MITNPSPLIEFQSKVRARNTSPLFGLTRILFYPTIREPYKYIGLLSQDRTYAQLGAFSTKIKA